MGDPYYWYWATSSTTMRPAPGPSMGEVLLVVLIPLILIALCLGFALWEVDDHPRRRRGLTRHERHERHVLAELERALQADAPDLARRFADFDARAPSSPPPRRRETTT
jgi:hypothetical protein